MGPQGVDDVLVGQVVGAGYHGLSRFYRGEGLGFFGEFPVPPPGGSPRRRHLLFCSRALAALTIAATSSWEDISPCASFDLYTVYLAFHPPRLSLVYETFLRGILIDLLAVLPDRHDGEVRSEHGYVGIVAGDEPALAAALADEPGRGGRGHPGRFGKGAPGKG